MLLWQPRQDWRISGICQWRSHGVAIGVPMAYPWCTYGVLRNSFVLSGIDFIFGMVLV